MTPPSVNEPTENEIAPFADGTEFSGAQAEPLEEAGIRSYRPAEAEMASAGDHWPQRDSQPLPPDGLHVELSARPDDVKPDSEISEAELVSLLADAHNADRWSDIARPSAGVRSAGAPLAPSSAMTEHEIRTCQTRSAGGSSELGLPPPDIESAAAKKLERPLSLSEIDTLLARLLGG